MKNDENNPFAGLPITLVNKMLEESGQIAKEIYEPFREIYEDRDRLRGLLQEHDIIQEDSGTKDVEPLPSCGIDGCSIVEKLFTSEFACCAAFAGEGLLLPSGKKAWDNPPHMAELYSERQCSSTAELLGAVMMEMEVELAAGAPHDIILLNGSFIRPFVTIMGALKLAFESKESKTAQEFIGHIKTSIHSLQTIFDSRNAPKIWVGISKDISSKELITHLQLPPQYDDIVLCTLLLSPGEFTTPVTVENTELFRVKNVPIKDENFAAVRDSLIEDISKLNILYYKPYEWTPVFRIELADSIAQDSSRFAKLLNSIKYQCSTAGITDPYPLYSTGRTVKSLGRAITSLCKSATSHITKLHKGNIDELLPLLLLKISNRRDYNG